MTASTSTGHHDVLHSQRGHLTRLLVITSTYPRWQYDPEPGFVHELATRLIDRFEVTVVCPHAAGAKRDEMLDGVRVLRYGYAPPALETLVNDGGIVTNLRKHPWKWALVPGFFLFQWLALRKVRRQWHPDVIHAHWLLPQGIIVSMDANTPFVVTSHGADLFAIRGRLYGRLRAYVLARATAVTVVSRAMRDRILADHPGTEIRVMPMGVDFDDRFTPPGPGQPRSKTRILFVGRLVGKKGVIHLVEAMPTVLARHKNASLEIVGFGPEKDRLVARVAALGIGDSVRFVGAVPQAGLAQFYREAAVCVAPFVEAAGGDQEGLGLVVAEAIGCLCPVLVGDVPAAHDLVGHASSSIVPQADPVALAHAIIRILDDPAGALEQTVELRAMIEKKFSWSSVSAGYAGLLESIASAERDSR